MTHEAKLNGLLPGYNMVLSKPSKMLTTYNFSWTFYLNSPPRKLCDRLVLVGKKEGKQTRSRIFSSEVNAVSIMMYNAVLARIRCPSFKIPPPHIFFTYFRNRLFFHLLHATILRSSLQNSFFFIIYSGMQIFPGIVACNYIWMELYAR